MTTKVQRGFGTRFLDDMASSIIKQLKCLSDEELASVKRAASSVSTSNCWYARFDLATKGIRPFIAEEYRERPIRRKQEAKS